MSSVPDQYIDASTEIIACMRTKKGGKEQFLSKPYHGEWLTEDNGHTAWKSLKHYLSYRSEI